MPIETFKVREARRRSNPIDTALAVTPMRAVYRLTEAIGGEFYKCRKAIDKSKLAYRLLSRIANRVLSRIAYRLLSGIAYRVLSGIAYRLLSGIAYRVLSGIAYRVLSGIAYRLLSGIAYRVLSGIAYRLLSGIAYRLLSGIAYRVLSGIAYRLLSGIAYRVLSGITYRVLSGIAYRLLSGIAYRVLSGIAYRLLSGIAYRVLSGIAYRLLSGIAYRVLSGIAYRLLSGIAYRVLSGIAYRLLSGIAYRLLSGIAYRVLSGIAYRLLSGIAYRVLSGIAYRVLRGIAYRLLSGIAYRLSTPAGNVDPTVLVAFCVFVCHVMVKSYKRYSYCRFEFYGQKSLDQWCAEGLWGSKCQNRCSPGCSLGCAKDNGTCLDECKPGWTGDNCQEVCTDYKYGVNCINSCGHCHEEMPCNVVTGKCSDGCLPGFQGDKCIEGCEPYKYGANCNLTCGSCRLNKTCNSMWGMCAAGCDRGWLGQTCDQACESGFYGLDCVEKCGHCKANTTCHHVTGKCESGCAPGWTGEICNELCRPGQFGPNCRDNCGSCLKGSCDHVTGECNGGCARGFYGPQCKEGCQAGYYGENCSQSCGHCQKASSCDPVNGICRDGCAPGFYGVHCFQNCSAGTYGEGCKFLCGRCVTGTSCDVQTGVCHSGCEDGWEGDKCDTGVQKTSNTFHSSPTFPVLIISLVAAVILISLFFTYFMVVRPRKTALRRLYNTSSNEHLSNTYEQIVGSPWELQRGQLSLSNELLGNGQFGQVKRGHVKINGVKVPVAIKSLKDNASAKDKRDFLNELSILKRVGKHENVVCLVGACHIKGVMYVAMEYAKHGDLRTFLRHSRRLTSLHEYDNTSSPFLHTALRPQSLIKLSLDTANGLKHLAEKQIIHRDVAARNVLLGEKLVAKIADFGLSKNDQTYVKTSSTRVPIRWMAVESLFNNTYTLQSDVWSFGVLLWEIFTLGGTPYSSIDSQQLFSYLKDGHRLRKPRLCDQDMYGMMLQCWNDVPERRPTIDELTARLQTMLEKSQVYMNITVQEESLYTEIDHEREISNSSSNYSS
ncbi:hypothetical protein Btru_039994 [Bulinus truncatus]|nr:hypothetical protein Btru_039994 [Bulinus truncatus]